MIIFYVSAAEESEVRKVGSFIIQGRRNWILRESSKKKKDTLLRFSEEREGETALGTFKGKGQCC